MIDEQVQELLEEGFPAPARTKLEYAEAVERTVTEIRERMLILPKTTKERMGEGRWSLVDAMCKKHQVNPDYIREVGNFAKAL
jgi:hypothetical protein